MKHTNMDYISMLSVSILTTPQCHKLTLVCLALFSAYFTKSTPVLSMITNK